MIKLLFSIALFIVNSETKIMEYIPSKGITCYLNKEMSGQCYVVNGGEKGFYHLYKGKKEGLEEKNLEYIYIYIYKKLLQ